MNSNRLNKMGAALLIIFSLVLVLMGKPTPQRSIGNIEDLGEMIASGESMIQPIDLADMIMAEEPGLTLVDLRDKFNFAYFNIEGSVKIPVAKLLKNDGLDALPSDGQIILICTSNIKASQAWVVLTSLGYQVYSLEGGIKAWITMLEGSEPEERAVTMRVHALREKYMGVGGSLSAPPPVAPAPAAPTGAKKKKKKAGGC